MELSELPILNISKIGGLDTRVVDRVCKHQKLGEVSYNAVPSGILAPLPHDQVSRERIALMIRGMQDDHEETIKLKRLKSEVRSQLLEGKAIAVAALRTRKGRKVPIMLLLPHYEIDAGVDPASLYLELTENMS